MSNTPEGKVKKKVVELFKKYQVWYFMPANNGFGKSGIPDLIAIVRGRFVGVECKADKTKKPTELQTIRGKEIQDAGGAWMVVYDNDTLAVLEKLITY
jgi:hypothetical protein